MHVAVLGTYPPTRCGIATFTADVESSLRLHGTEVTVVPVESTPEPGRLAIRRDDPESYAEAARRVAEAGCDVVLIQHEFGIFGGVAGEYLLRFVESLRIPYVITLHTVLPRYDVEQYEVIEKLCAGAACVTVFTGSARRLVLDQELVPARSLQVIAHGAPAELYSEIDVLEARRMLALPPEGPVMSTFGLLSPGKGIELAIRAMALLEVEHPDLIYVVAGRTHPEVVRSKGERYRHSLEALTDELGLTERVHFVDRFLGLDELSALLGVSDVVCTPYRGSDQSVSGVLTFALAAGCPIVSTPFRYARDVLADGAGLLVDFDDVERFADALHTLLDPQMGAQARAAARAASASMEWSQVGEELQSVLAEAIRRQVVEPASAPSATVLPMTVARPATTHLRLLCDDTAMLQHAQFNVPRIEDGYCVDDVGRVLPLLDELARDDQSWHVSTGRMLAFLRSAADDGDGLMRNFMSWNRRWLDQPHVGDHVGRAIWGLGELTAGGGPFVEYAADSLDRLVSGLSCDWPSKSLAYAALGLVAAADVDPSMVEAIERIRPALQEWRAPDDPAWDWCEPRLTYDNARIPEALIRVGHRLDDPVMVHHGAAMLRWLDTLCIQGTHYRLVGHRGLSDAKGLNWSGDEQPLEAAALADAHAAWFTISDETASLVAIDRLWSWFLGNNRLGEPLLDVESGAGFDGLGTREVNHNCGAESTIAVHRCARTAHAAGRLRPALPSEVTRISVHA